MGAAFQACEEYLEHAVNELFDADPQIQAVGIGRHEDGFGFKAVKNTAKILPSVAIKRVRRPPKSIRKIPVTIESVTQDIEPHAPVPFPLAASFVPEQQMHRPLFCGLQVQNVDDDTRQWKAGKLGPGLIGIGSLGCFVKLSGGATAILSNNHVLGGENRGQKKQDRILQPGSLTFSSNEHIATLTDFVPLRPSPNHARPAQGNVIYNNVDAAVAELVGRTSVTQSSFPARHLPAPHGFTAPKVGDLVFKVGRTTGLTHGSITAVSIVAGPILYDPGPCWFHQQFEIIGTNGTLFSDHGDSGAAILSTTGEVIGLLYAGNGTQTYACPIQAVSSALSCTLA
jgi:hypothetical protein